MTSIKIQGWEKKPRTTLRGIKVGDIFMLSLGDLTFAVGRILSKTSIGHGAEFFDLLLSRPEIYRRRRPRNFRPTRHSVMSK